VIAYFVAHRLLADPAAEDDTLHKPPRWLAPAGISIRGTGVAYFPISEEVTQIYLSFRLEAPINVGVV